MTSRDSIFLMTTMAALLFAISARAEIFYNVDFEDQTTNADPGNANPQLINGSITAVQNPDPDSVNNSQYVGRFYVPASTEKS